MVSGSRRHFLRWGAVGLAGAVLGGRVVAGAVADAAETGDAADGARAGTFDEVYRGRRIQGLLVAPGGRHLPSQAVLIDGRPLHVMRDPRGGFVSAVEHFRAQPTLHEVARRAVDLLDGAQLVATGHHHR
jgi:hypothetical protein